MRLLFLSILLGLGVFDSVTAQAQCGVDCNSFTSYYDPGVMSCTVGNGPVGPWYDPGSSGQCRCYDQPMLALYTCDPASPGGTGTDTVCEINPSAPVCPGPCKCAGMPCGGGGRPISGNTAVDMFDLQPGLTKKPPSSQIACTSWKNNTGGSSASSPDNTGTDWGCVATTGCYNATGITVVCPTVNCVCPAGNTNVVSGSSTWIDWKTCCPPDPANGSYTTSLPDPSVCTVTCNSGYTWDGTSCQPPAATTSAATTAAATTAAATTTAPATTSAATTVAATTLPYSTGTPPAPPAPPGSVTASSGTPAAKWNPTNTKCVLPTNFELPDSNGICPANTQRFKSYCGTGFYCIRSKEGTSGDPTLRNRSQQTSDYNK